MVQSRNLGTGNIPLKLAQSISKVVNAEWESGEFLEKVTPITKDLLRFWDPKGSFSDLRHFNFHKGQWQAILNTIYIHEVLKLKNVQDIYMTINPELLAEMDLLDMQKGKYSHPKYCIKMATGTGKTWVMHALLIWQYLNAKNDLIQKVENSLLPYVEVSEFEDKTDRGKSLERDVKPSEKFPIAHSGPQP